MTDGVGDRYNSFENVDLSQTPSLKSREAKFLHCARKVAEGIASGIAVSVCVGEGSDADTVEDQENHSF
jgi:hypothetical protein